MTVRQKVGTDDSSGRRNKGGRSALDSLAVLQFHTGQKLSCLAQFDGEQHIVEVLRTRTEVDGTTSYYVHYTERDKRLDEWVGVERLSLIKDENFLQTQQSKELISSKEGTQQRMTRTQKRKFSEIHHNEEDAAQNHETHSEQHQPVKPKNILSVELGRYEIDAWYYSPYPHPYDELVKLYVCEFTLKYFRRKKTLLVHYARCRQRQPPGDLIYTSEDEPGPSDFQSKNNNNNKIVTSLFEVDGRKNRVYCQNLCLLSKLFLDHKTLYYDVDPFLFYVLCEYDEKGHHIVGYFSKERNSQDFNLACILTLPPYQSRGYGKLLISFSYELSRRDGVVGTPERPLSDLGQVAYRSYWNRVIMDLLYQHKGESLSIKNMSDLTSIAQEDVADTLSRLGLLHYYKGQHIVSQEPTRLEELHKLVCKKTMIEIDLSRLSYTPIIPKTKSGRR